MKCRPLLSVDIGGEGRHDDAWNINPRRMKTFGSKCGEPIPRLILGRADAVPLPDHSADTIIVERTPLSRLALDEIKRIGEPGSIVVLRHARAFAMDPHELAKRILLGKFQERDYKIGTRDYQETVITLDTSGTLRQLAITGATGNKS
jgi:hypothetical protein